jgi:hypothetical protein
VLSADISEDLAAVGDRDFPLPHGRGEETHHGSPGLDPRGLPKGVKVLRSLWAHRPHQGEGTEFQVKRLSGQSAVLPMERPRFRLNRSIREAV